MIEKVLNRKPFEALLDDGNFKKLQDKRILITGAGGSIGQRLFERLSKICKVKPLPTDRDTMDVTNPLTTRLMIDKYQPDVIIHLAGMKHAPQGEVNPLEAIDINIHGTHNPIKNLDILDKPCKVVLASTCKANNPEIVYGATKLIAERLTLNAGGSVARFFNVVETSGNVFVIWEEQKNKKVADCVRYFISLDEAVGLLMFTAMAPQGRYTVNVIQPQYMKEIYRRLYNEVYELIPPRRGDRVEELLKSTSETRGETFLDDSIVKLNSTHDL